MTIPNRPSSPTGVVGLNWLITDDGSRTLYDQRLKESYHSGCGALAESWLVYVINSGVAHRLNCGQATGVVEYGLGTGTSFLLTAALAEMRGIDLLYIGIENNLLPCEVVADLNLEQAAMSFRGDQGWQNSFRDPCFQRHLARLQERWASLLRETASLSSPACLLEVAPHTRLALLQEDACVIDSSWLASRLGSELVDGIQAVYFDPFSPEVNPELWQIEVLRNTYNWLDPGGSFTSYCVKSRVRKDLERVGYSVQRVAGPAGGKRQVLLAHKPST